MRDLSRAGAPMAPREPAPVGLGLRWEFLKEVVEGPLVGVDFFEVSPENYMRRGGYYPAMLERVRERYPLLTHGLTLSIGASAEPDEVYLRALEGETRRLASPWHSDHLCFSSVGGRALHDLFPLKHSRENVRRLIDRSRRIQDALGIPFALENISYYAEPGRAEMPEHEFIANIVEGADIGLLLDVNNVFVNAQNHGRNPYELIALLPLSRVVEIHVAGHARREDGLLIDTHGAPVIDPVLELLSFTLERTGPRPVLLERDNDVPPLQELLHEVARLRQIAERAARKDEERHASTP